MNLYIYTPEITPRIVFTFDVILKSHLGLNYRLVDSESEFQALQSPKFSYAAQPVSDEIFFWRHPMMLETEISPQDIQTGEFEGEPIFFPSPEARTFLPFDIFGMVFYLLSRYEEYLPHRKDAFGRFPATESLAFRAGFLEKPLVDIWILKLAERLKSVFPNLACKTSSFKQIATFDIDNAYAFRHRDLWRISGGLLKQLVKFDFKEIRRRLSILNGKTPDPCDNYDFIESLCQKYRAEAIFFILFAGRSRYDRGLPPSNKALQRLIKRLSARNIVGIHPSFSAHSDEKKLRRETASLARVLERTITHARAHFLLLDFPKTYQKYLENGITDDYTLGFADLAGFRASTAKPFPFFDLSRNETTALTLYPFAYMDATLIKYMKKSPDEAAEIVQRLVDQVKSVGGNFISLWHNDNLNAAPENPWREFYEKTWEI